MGANLQSHLKLQLLNEYQKEEGTRIKNGAFSYFFISALPYWIVYILYYTKQLPIKQKETIVWYLHVLFTLSLGSVIVSLVPSKESVLCSM